MKIKIGVIFLLLSINGISQLSLRVETSYELRLIRCEPIIVRVILENKGENKEEVGAEGMVYLSKLKGFYMLINNKEYRGPWYEYKHYYQLKAGAKDYLGKGEKIVEEIDLRIIGLKEGIYEIQALLDLRGKRYESNKIKLEIRLPMGVDMEANRYAEEYVKKNNSKWYKLDDKSFCKYLTEYSKGNDFVLENYPTSTYAGWVLARRTSGIDLIYLNGKDLIEDIFRPAKERTGRKGSIGKDKNNKDIWVLPEEEAREYIPLAEKFLSENPNHILSGFIYGRLSLGYLLLQLWDKASESIKESLNREWPIFLYSNDIETMNKHREVLKEVREELIKKKLIKED